MDDLGKWLKAQLDEDIDYGFLELKSKLRLVELHGHEPRTGWDPDDDDTPGAYGNIERACMTCGSQDLAVRWPCETIRLLALPFSDRPGYQEEWRARVPRG